jgi:hypothetical protein
MVITFELASMYIYHTTSFRLFRIGYFLEFLIPTSPAAASRCPRATRPPLRAPALRENDPEAGPARWARSLGPLRARAGATAAPSCPIQRRQVGPFDSRTRLSIANWDLFKEEFDKLCLTKPLRHRNDLPYFDYCSRVFEGADDLTPSDGVQCVASPDDLYKFVYPNLGKGVFNSRSLSGAPRLFRFFGTRAHLPGSSRVRSARVAALVRAHY